MELRQGYKNTEVGVIPEDWEVKTLGELSNIYRGASPRPIDDPIWFDEKSQIGWVRISDVTKSKRRLKETTQRLSELGVRHSRFVPTGSLIMSICATVGRPIITDIDVCIHDGFVIFEKSQVSQDFLYHSLKSLESDWSKSGQTGSQMNLNTGIINPTKIPLPPTKAEQEAIAEALSNTDTLIESLEQLIVKKRNLKQGAMQKLLTGKKRLLGFQNSNGFKRCELGLIPADWNCMQLPNLTVQSSGSIKIGPFGSALKKEYLTKEGFKVYGQENLYEKNMDIGDRCISSEHFRKLRSCEIKAGDFLISMMGTVGKCLIVPPGIKEGIMDSHLLRIRLDTGKLCSNFLSQLFETKLIYDQVKQLSVGGIMEGLSSKIIKSLNLPVPTVEEQLSIANVLSDMDAEITALETKLAKTRQLKQGMMHNLLTGRIRLI